LPKWGGSSFLNPPTSASPVRNGKKCTPAQYDKISDISNNLIKVEQNDKLGFINLKNQIVTPIMYDIDTNFSVEERVNKQLDFDEKGEIAKTTIMVGVDEKYTNFFEGLGAVIKHGKYGFIDTLGNIKAPFQFDGADNFFNNVAIVKNNYAYGAINKSGQLVIPFEYDLLVVDESEWIYAQKNGDTFCINSEGKRLKK
jgi:WG containing repeat